MVLLNRLMFLQVALAVAAILAHNSYASYIGVASINASVDVYCPFNVSLNVSPGYIDYGNFTVNYTISTSEPCSLNNLVRTLDIYYPNYTLLHEYVATLKSINTTPAKYYVAINSSIFPSPVTYPIKLTVSNLTYKKSATSQIVLIPSVNLFVSNLSVPPSIKQFAILPVNVTILNRGGLASPNATLVVNISGPVSHSFNYTVPALNPASSVKESLSIPNVTTVAGTYTLTAEVFFTVNSTLRHSNVPSAQFNVYSPPPPPPSSSAPPSP
ncbi:MAG: CARDB domain-containing protein, partial [Candidatus Micrarchaeaceae archaeon]